MKIDLYKNGFSDRFMRILVLTVGCLGLFIANLWPINARAEKAEAIESAAREKLHETQQQIRSRGVRARGDLKFYSGKVSLRAIDLSQDLQTEDLVKAGQLGSPLTPSTSNSNNAETDQADNRQFAEAIQKWNQHHYDEAVKLFAAHITRPGQSVISENKLADFGFAGHYTGVGPTLAPYRLYKARLGRWISRDPLGEEGGINQYVYAGNDPVNRIDPKGQDPEEVAIWLAMLATAHQEPETPSPVSTVLEMEQSARRASRTA